MTMSPNIYTSNNAVLETLGLNKPIFFDEGLHKYTDSDNTQYISVTTFHKLYEPEFDDVKVAKLCAKIGSNPNHPKYDKYRGKSYKQILAEWKDIRDEACDIGNDKHSYIEVRVKLANGYNNHIANYMISGGLYTVYDAIINNSIGELNIDTLIRNGFSARYPTIFRIIEHFHNEGYRIFSEVGVFSYKYKIAGLIDLLILKDDIFYIVDWKTNKYDIRKEAGYYEKDNQNNITSFRPTNAIYKFPLSHIPYSLYYKYALQVSQYAYLTEEFNIKCVGLILAHITHSTFSKNDIEVEREPHLLGKEKVKLLELPYLRSEIDLLTKHFVATNN